MAGRPAVAFDLYGKLAATAGDITMVTNTMRSEPGWVPEVGVEALRSRVTLGGDAAMIAAFGVRDGAPEVALAGSRKCLAQARIAETASALPRLVSQAPRSGERAAA